MEYFYQFSFSIELLMIFFSSSAFPIDETRQNLQMLEIKQEENSRKSVFITLLEVYTKYKLELFNPAINEHDVWNKISNEMQDRCCLDCDELQCRNKIQELRSEYERIKNIANISQDVAEFYCTAEKAFGNSKSLGIFFFEYPLHLYKSEHFLFSL